MPSLSHVMDIGPLAFAGFQPEVAMSNESDTPVPVFLTYIVRVTVPLVLCCPNRLLLGRFGTSCLSRRQGLLKRLLTKKCFDFIFG